ncbi:MAG: sigma-70 family RNA polymerase sigma factor [Candidatus Marinimicrobia bacterium]|nr:sigma-70 family RNA polymerase sigma factor [Candidatus Neomarinimicrobiota bacterium]
MTGVDDQALLERLRSGDPQAAFRELVAAHGKAIYNVALFTLNDEIMAADATQEVFIRIWRGLKGFKAQAKLASWIYRITKNVCYDYLKKRRPERLDEDGEGALADNGQLGPEGEYLAGQQHLAVRRAVARLPERQRMAITLHYFHQRSYEEVAEIMEQPLGTVKSYLHRAKASLAGYLKEMEGRLV